MNRNQFKKSETTWHSNIGESCYKQGLKYPRHKQIAQKMGQLQHKNIKSSLTGKYLDRSLRYISHFKTNF